MAAGSRDRSRVQSRQLSQLFIILNSKIYTSLIKNVTQSVPFLRFLEIPLIPPSTAVIVDLRFYFAFSGCGLLSSSEHVGWKRVWNEHSNWQRYGRNCVKHFPVVFQAFGATEDYTQIFQASPPVWHRWIGFWRARAFRGDEFLS